MTTDLPEMSRKLTVTEWVAIFSLILSVGGLIFSGGFVYGQVQANTTRLDRLEPKMDDMAIRVERIDANVEWLRRKSEE